MKVYLFSQRSVHLYLLHLLLPFVCHDVAANTEIINFSSSRERRLDLPWDVVGNWSKLGPSDNERRWTLELAALHTPLHQVCEQGDHVAPFSCPHETWVLLDLDDPNWASHSSFTLRLSWAASTPADLTMALYTPRDMLDRLAPAHGSTNPNASTPASYSATRSRYARIRAVDAGVPIATRSPRFHPPRPLPLPPGIITVTDPAQPGDIRALHHHHEIPSADTLAFVLVLEPLYLGVVPASMCRTACVLVSVVLAAGFSVDWVMARLNPFVRLARADARAVATTKKER